jgi:dUTP pyrophosphatase
MSEVRVAIKPLHPELGGAVPYPRRMSEHASGLDLAAAIDRPITLAPGERTVVPCGFAMAIPPGFEAQTRPRSGLSLEHGITIANTPGTIDADYRGEVKVILINLGNQPFEITQGMRIAQMVIAPVVCPHVDIVVELDATARGAGGFGSTGARG